LTEKAPARPIEACGFMCLSCGTFWRDDRVKREACPFCGVPRCDCRELVLVLGEERVDVAQPVPGTDKCSKC
jgi:hypothetical protein